MARNLKIPARKIDALLDVYLKKRDTPLKGLYVLLVRPNRIECCVTTSSIRMILIKFYLDTKDWNNRDKACGA